jgi:hypothetical protein
MNSSVLTRDAADSAALAGALASGDTGVVCVLKLDSCYGYGSNLKYEYHVYRTKGVADLHAGKFVTQMQKDGFLSPIRAVFVFEENRRWRTVGSCFYVGP